MKAHLIGKFFSTLFLLFYWVSTFAQNITLEVGQHEKEATIFLLPFAFHTEALKTAVGLSAIGAGHFQPQASVFAAVFTTTNDSTAAYIGIQDAQLPIG